MLQLRTMICLASLALLGCEARPESGRGFRLPDGDAEAGRVAFEQLQCATCHSVEGVEFAPPEQERVLDVRLGGRVLHVRTYGELVTAIINPSHDIAREYRDEDVALGGTSLMADYNDAMTVRQMIDLVAFLQPTYEKYLPDDYEPYFP